MKHEMTPEQHIEANIATALDQSHEYDATPDWREGDAYMVNLRDSMRSDGYDEEAMFDAFFGFSIVACERGVRFGE